jgi:hypothetical protein
MTYGLGRNHFDNHDLAADGEILFLGETWVAIGGDAGEIGLI